MGCYLHGYHFQILTFIVYKTEGTVTSHEELIHIVTGFRNTPCVTILHWIYARHMLEWNLCLIERYRNAFVEHEHSIKVSNVDNNTAEFW